MQQDIEDLQDQVAAILARIQSITYVPKYADGRAVMTYTDNGTLTPGAAVFDFELKPAATAAELAGVWQTALSMQAVYTITRAPETANLTIESATADGAYLTVTVSGSGLKEAFFRSQCAANVRLLVSDGNNDLTTDYIRMIPWTTDVITFADANFKAYCVENFDTNSDGELTEEEAEAVTAISASMLNIASLAGIEYFSNLTTLDVSFNKLTTLDLSRLTKLTDVQVNGNKLTSLNLTGLSALTTLDCSNNKLTELSVGDAAGLTTLNCSNNQIGALDLKNNKVLADLQCSSNNLAALNLKNNTKLTTLLCRKNALTVLDVTKQPLLVDLDCSNNTLASMNVYGNTALETLYCASCGLTSLGVTANTALTVLDCSGNALTALDVTKNTLLETLNCSNNTLTSLDVSRNAALESVNCQGNTEMTKLWVKDAAQADALTIKKENATLIAYNNGGINIPDANLKTYLVANFDEDFDGEISPTEAEKITMVNCSGKSITDLTGLEVCTNLEYVNCADNTVERIDFHTLTKLKTLVCYNNTLESINLDNCSDLTAFYIEDVSTNAYSVDAENGAQISIQGYTQSESLAFSINVIPYRVAIYGSDVLETLNFSGCQCVSVVTNGNTAMTSITVDPSLEEYFGHGCTSLAGIDVSRCQNLRILQIYDNALVAVDVTHNPELISIQAQNNALTSVDLTQNPVLVSAILSDNSLTAINVQNNPLLETLDVGHNNLSAVNVTHNPALKVLKVNNNAGISIVNIIWNTSIETLDISFTGVTTLDTSKNVSLTEIQATGTPYSLQFKIGDYLEILGGIVFSNDGVVVKIVSIDEKEEQWGYYGTSIGATSTTDGVVNTNKIADKSNAAKWCRAKGANWYFPARQELQLIFDNKEIINSVLSSLGKELLDTSTGMYWSSTEGNANCAYCIHMNTGSWTNYTKTASFTVRAIRTL
jgi:Leucine-rich repeat (LRR) protein